MPQAPDREANARPRVHTIEEADRLIDAILGTMRALEALMADETGMMKDGRIADALAGQPRKNELTGTYLRQLEGLKANAIVLARLAPGALDALKASHRQFQCAVETNQAVLATARAVSEGLIRSLSDEVNANMRPTTYGGDCQVTSSSAQGVSPLVVCKRL